MIAAHDAPARDMQTASTSPMTMPMAIEMTASSRLSSSPPQSLSKWRQISVEVEVHSPCVRPGQGRGALAERRRCVAAS